VPVGQDKLGLPLRTGWDYNRFVKITDDYHAKVRLWSLQPTVVPLPSGPKLQKFAAQKFRTHQEMNQWKKSLLRQLAQTLVSHG
jgi:hypothetical protein